MGFPGSAPKLPMVNPFRPILLRQKEVWTYDLQSPAKLDLSGLASSNQTNSYILSWTCFETSVKYQCEIGRQKHRWTSLNNHFVRV